MAYFKQCPCCGAHLDPGERCDCLGSKVLSAYNNASPEIKAQADAIIDRWLAEEGIE